MLDKINYIEVDFIEAFNEWFFNNKTIVCMTGKMKQQAKEFALSFLMPRKIFRENLKECFCVDNTIDMKKMAKLSNTKQKYVYERGVCLGYIQPN